MKICFINPPFKAEYGKFSRGAIMSIESFIFNVSSGTAEGCVPTSIILLLGYFFFNISPKDA